VPKRNPKITKVRVEKNYRTITLDNGNVFRISEDVFLFNPMSEGEEVSQAFLKNVTEKQTEKDVRDAGLRLIKYRMRSRNELKTRLLQKGFSNSVVLKALDWFEELKFIDDVEFAKCFANEKVRNKKIGAIALKADFFPHYLNADLVESVISDVYKIMPEEDLIKQHLKKRRLSDLPSLSQKEMKKLTDFLMRKGFRWDSIRNVFVEKGWV
jgi:regulatory protein